MTNEEIVKRFQFDFAIGLFKPKCTDGIFNRKTFVFEIKDQLEWKKMKQILHGMKYKYCKTFNESVDKIITHVIVYPCNKRFDPIYMYVSNNKATTTFRHSLIDGKNYNNLPDYVKEYEIENDE